RLPHPSRRVENDGPTIIGLMNEEIRSRAVSRVHHLQVGVKVERHSPASAVDGHELDLFPSGDAARIATDADIHGVTNRFDSGTARLWSTGLVEKARTEPRIPIAEIFETQAPEMSTTLL